MNKKNTNGFVPFTGTVEELLSHMETVDSDRVERVMVDQTEDVTLSDDEAISLIKSESNVGDEEALSILKEVKRTAIQDAITKLVDMGFIEVSSYDDENQPLYELTEYGKAFAGSLREKKSWYLVDKCKRSGRLINVGG